MKEPRQPTSDQISTSISRGATGDKVDYPDPAAAPLGTDEEAAGTPLGPVALSQAQEYERRPAFDEANLTASHRKQPGTQAMIWIWGMLGVVVIIGLLLVLRG
jgi:hypothetical protein